MEQMGVSYNKDIPAGSEETRIIQFAAPGALNTPVLGTDNKTGETFFNLATVNTLIRAIENLAQTAPESYEYNIERDGYLVRTLYSDNCKRELQGPVWPGFPLNFTNGQYQVRMIQTVLGGGLAARNLSMVWQKALV